MLREPRPLELEGVGSYGVQVQRGGMAHEQPSLEGVRFSRDEQ